MGNVGRRLIAIEKQLRIGPKPELQEGFVQFEVPEDIAEHIPDNVAEWLTYQRARAEALERLEKTGFDLFMFVADPKKEYEAQQATKNDQKQRISEK